MMCPDCKIHMIKFCDDFQEPIYKCPRCRAEFEEGQDGLEELHEI